MESSPISAPRTSKSAIASLVCGLLGCIPFVSGLAAVILGIVGIRRTRDPMVTGKGMAIAGLILGVLSIGGWTVATVVTTTAVVAVLKMGEPARLVAEEFTKDLSESKVDAASALTVEGTDSKALAALSEKMKPWGACQSLKMTSVDMKEINEDARVTIGGAAMFANETRSYTMTLKKVAGAYKVEKYDFP